MSFLKIMAPLVSIIVITYNSSEFVHETLESVRQQTYRNIELIISDDGSSDNTLDVCNEWITGNHEYFIRTELISSKINTGIPANCNRGIKASKGEWIKIIAGDDLLDKNVISNLIDHISYHSEINLLWTNVGTFYDTDKPRVISIPKNIATLSINREGISSQQQFQIMLRQNPIFTGGLLIKREVFQKIGLFNESYPSFEDRPFLHKALLNKFQLHYIDIVGAYYRKHKGSVQMRNSKLLRNSFHIDVFRYEISISDYYKNSFERCIRSLIARYNLFYVNNVSNKKNIFNKVLVYVPTWIMRGIIRPFNRLYW